MARTKVKNKCMLCGEELKEGKAVYICMVNLTKKAIPYRKIEKDELRIQHLTGKKLRNGIHLECWQKLQEKIS